jgi:hypothetical protein
MSVCVNASVCASMLPLDQALSLSLTHTHTHTHTFSLSLSLSRSPVCADMVVMEVATTLSNGTLASFICGVHDQLSVPYVRI